MQESWIRLARVSMYSVDQPFSTSALAILPQFFSTEPQIFEKVEIVGVKKENYLSIGICKKKSINLPVLTKVNLWMPQNFAKKYMKIDFTKEIFANESRETFGGHDGWTKGQISLNSEESLANRRQQGDGSDMIWTGIVDKTIIGQSSS